MGKYQGDVPMRPRGITTVLALCAGAFLVAGAAPCSADTIVVGPGGDFFDIRPAVAAAQEGDTILVMPGTYAGSENRGIDFEGRNLTLTSASGPTETTIDCDGADRAFRLHSGERQETVISGFTVRNGHAPFGGGAYFIYASPTLENCVFEDCSAEFSGGGIRASMGSPVITNCLISRCTAEEEGGGISLHEATASITTCSLTQNEAESGGGISGFGACAPMLLTCDFAGNSADAGGGAYFNGCEVDMDRCDFTGNTAPVRGGGLFCESASLVMSECELSANYSGGNGGGMSLLGTSPASIHDCEFSSNDAEVKGGAAQLASGGTYSILRCVFTGNRSLGGSNVPGTPNGEGGALSVYSVEGGVMEDCVFLENSSGHVAGAVDFSSSGGIDAIRRCTFSRNSAVYGGALIGPNTDSTVEDCLFVLNEAEETGGAIFFPSGTIDGCTFERNRAEIGGALYIRLRSPNVTACTFVGNVAVEGSATYLDDCGGTLSECLMAFGDGVVTHDPGVHWYDISTTVVTHCVVFGNVGGDDLFGEPVDNIIADPLVCGFYESDFSLCANSPCLPGNNAWGVLVGAHDEGCDACDTPVEATSWGAIKAMFR